MRELAEAISSHAKDRMIFMIDQSHVGLTYHEDSQTGICNGDILVGLLGINSPFILRRNESPAVDGKRAQVEAMDEVLVEETEGEPDWISELAQQIGPWTNSSSPTMMKTTIPTNRLQILQQVLTQSRPVARHEPHRMSPTVLVLCRIVKDAPNSSDSAACTSSVQSKRYNRLKTDTGWTGSSIWNHKSSGARCSAVDTEYMSLFPKAVLLAYDVSIRRCNDNTTISD
jgi:hypothetical protein